MDFDFKEKVYHDAEKIHDEIIDVRRRLHGFAEVGFEVPKTHKFITDKLKEMGYAPKKCGKAGVVATVGSGGKTILLRADIDALPIREKSGEEFAARNGHSHSCGHDMHPSILLGTAKLLKHYESSLKGTVKLMFQPAEELLLGAKDMIEDGLMESPTVDAAMALHVAVMDPMAKSGNLIFKSGDVNSSGDAIKVTIHGKDTHGGRQHTGVDALSIASYLNLALQTVVSKEVANDSKVVLLVGTAQAGTTCNTVAGEAVLDISIRASNNSERDFLLKRVEEVSKGISQVFRATATVEHLYGAPVLNNHAAFTKELTSYAKDIIGEDRIIEKFQASSAGEDFSYIAELVPSMFFYLGAGSEEEGFGNQLHNPGTRFNEDVIKDGIALNTYLSMKWLEENQSC